MLGSSSAVVSTVSGRTRVGVHGEDHGLDLDEAAVLHAELSKIGYAAVHAVGANERLVGCCHSLQRQLHHVAPLSLFFVHYAGASPGGKKICGVPQDNLASLGCATSVTEIGDSTCTGMLHVTH